MFTKLCRIGNEPAVRFTPSGTAVLNLSLAYAYGQKGDDGKKPTQWIEASMWGKQAEATAPYFKKGDQVSVCIDDMHIETYEGKNGTGSKLVGKIVSFDFVGGKPSGDQEKPAASEKPAAKSAPAKSSFDDFDSPIPF